MGRRSLVKAAAGTLEIEIVIRLILAILFLATEELKPFTRVIHKEEFWLLSNPRTPSYYPTWLLCLTAFCFPPFIIFLISFCQNAKEEATKGWLAVSFSLLFTATVTNMVKNMVGRPRPDFMGRCFSAGIPEQPFDKDGVTLLCNGDEADIREGRKSFPSGHSSIMFSSIGFLTFYLRAKLQVTTSGRGQAWRLIVVSLPVIFCLLVALSRTCDYHHHWQDVTVGSCFGISVAYWSYCQYFPKCQSLPIPDSRPHMYNGEHEWSIDCYNHHG